MKHFLSLAFCLCIFMMGNCQENWDSIQVTSQQVQENIYVLKGAGGNIGILTGADGIVMIDDQFLQLGKKIKDAIASLDKGPIRFTLNTHIHGDHSGSNEYFKQLGSIIVAHDLVRERMSKESFTEGSNSTTPPRDKDAWPVVTFPNKLTLHLNDQDIDLIHFEPGHTDGDVIIHFKQANVFHMGDVFVTYGYPYIDMSSGGSINGLIATLDQSLALMNETSMIIPGHGELCKKADVVKYRNRLADIRDKVSAALKKGKKPEELAGLDITNAYEAEWGKGFIKGKDFVMIVAADLKDKGN
jgi:glyoxylase-like metal-dependent hydrolase (beta-lactamase superfamily II)